MRDPKDGKLGLRLETGASMLVTNFARDHFGQFANTMASHRNVSETVYMEYVNALAGVIALAVASRHGTLEEIMAHVHVKLAEYVKRDLDHLGRKRQ